MDKGTIRDKAVALLAHVPWGTHCCNFYKTKTDLLSILTPYFRAGLLNNELCLWITSKPLDVKDAVRAMGSVLPRFDSFLKKGQIEIHPHAEWYLDRGGFSARRALTRWIGKCEQATAAGFEGVRLTGNAFRLETRSWKKFVEYEAELDKAIAEYPIKAVCTYSLDMCRAYEVIDVVKNHGYALIKRRSWELIENAHRRLVEEKAIESAMRELERLVGLRTAELQDTNRKLRVEIGDRERVERDLRASREQLRALAAYLESVREEERTRIARELHDEIGQALTAIKLSLERNAGETGGPLKADLEQAAALANELIGRVRDLSLDLRPAMLDDLGLLPALAWHFDRYAEQVRIAVDFKHAGLEGRRFDPKIETAAYRIVQEALTNVARHARVLRAEVGVWADEDRLCIRVRDGGAGFDPESVSDAGSSGLSGMRGRAILLGGKFVLKSAPGTGTLLTAELPLGIKPGAGGR